MQEESKSLSACEFLRASIESVEPELGLSVFNRDVGTWIVLILPFSVLLVN
jgi:hypothetical protein